MRQTTKPRNPSKPRHELKVADEVWLAAALLHREQPDRADYTVAEIVERARQEGLTPDLRPGVYVHAVLHCVAWGYSSDRTKLRAWVCSSPRRASTTRGPLESSGRGSGPMPTAWITWAGCGGPRASSVPAAGIVADGPPRMVATSARPAVAG